MRILPLLPFLLLSCSSTPSVPPVSSIPPVLTTPKLTDSQKIEIWFSFHENILKEMDQTQSIYKLHDLSLDSKEIQKAAERDLFSWKIPPEDRAQFENRLRVAKGEEILRWSINRDRIKYSTKGTLSHSKDIAKYYYGIIFPSDPDPVIVEKTQATIQCLHDCSLILDNITYYDLQQELKEVLQAVEGTVQKASFILDNKKQLQNYLSQP